MAITRDKPTKGMNVEKLARTEDLPHCSKMTKGKNMTEKKRTLRPSSSSSEEEVDETRGKISTQKEPEKILTESIIKDLQSEAGVNQIAESGQRQKWKKERALRRQNPSQKQSGLDRKKKKKKER